MDQVVADGAEAAVTEREQALCDHLMAMDALDAAGLARVRSLQAAEAATAPPRRLSGLLTQLGIVSERDMAQALAKALDLPLAGVDDYAGEPPAVDRLNARFLRKAGALPIGEAEDALVVAMTDPLDEFSLQALRLALGRPLRPVVAVPSELEEAFQRMFGEGKTEIAEIVGDEAEKLSLDEDDAERLKDLASGAPVVRLVSLLIAKAVETRASDIHIEPAGQRLRVRCRIDGMLHDMESPPARLTAGIVSRIKIMAKLNIAERRLPQDGRVRLAVRGVQVDLRISIVPTMHGERVVIRILDSKNMPVGLEGLGFDAPLLGRFGRWLTQPNGIVLVTGPTGSGKSTTLYGALQTMDAQQQNIITVEDPIEYQLASINQIQVKAQIGLTFAHVLRAILRQDPDVIMIGEIRDRETAEIAIHAALTGHLVMSTLHTNTAAGAVGRLIDMGVEDYLLTSALLGVMAQRLVRRLCLACRQPYAPSAGLLAEMGLPQARPADGIMLYQAGGCASCSGTGYSGRLCIAEVLELTDPIRRLILARASSQELHEAAVQGGMRAMFQDGVEKVLAGITTIEEIVRVTRTG